MTAYDTPADLDRAEHLTARNSDRTPEPAERSPHWPHPEMPERGEL